MTIASASVDLSASANAGPRRVTLYTYADCYFRWYADDFLLRWTDITLSGVQDSIDLLVNLSQESVYRTRNMTDLRPSCNCLELYLDNEGGQVVPLLRLGSYRYTATAAQCQMHTRDAHVDEIGSFIVPRERSQNELALGQFIFYCLSSSG